MIYCHSLQRSILWIIKVSGCWRTKKKHRWSCRNKWPWWRASIIIRKWIWYFLQNPLPRPWRRSPTRTFSDERLVGILWSVSWWEGSLHTAAWTGGCSLHKNKPPRGPPIFTTVQCVFELVAFTHPAYLFSFGWILPKMLLRQGIE